MSVGNTVNKSILDIKAGQAVVALRFAFDLCETVDKFLVNTPMNSDNTDPLVTVFGYTADEAYALRLVFQTIEGVRTANQTTWDTARKISGLE
jgi:hypothetical protein